MSITCLIADDEHLARKLLESYLAKIPGMELVASCPNAMEAMVVLQRQKVDLLFLDIEMPDLSGVELVKTLQPAPFIIFITAHSGYAVQSYELNVVDYLLKPVSFERFVKAVNRAAERISLHERKQQEPAPPQAAAKDHLMVKVDYKLVKVKFDDILYIESLKEYLGIVTAEKRLVTLGSMKHMEELLPAGQFARIHKSYIVATNQVKAIVGNNLDLGGSKLLPIGRLYRDKIKDLFRPSV